MEGYVRGWIGAMLDDGSMQPGLYCAKVNANELLAAVQPEYDARELSGRPAFWIVSIGNPVFTIGTSTPDQSGVPFADLWQGHINTSEQHGGVALRIDQNVATNSDASSVRSAFAGT
jgi:hypothetical protein